MSAAGSKDCLHLHLGHRYLLGIKLSKCRGLCTEESLCLGQHLSGCEAEEGYLTGVLKALLGLQFTLACDVSEQDTCALPAQSFTSAEHKGI